MLRICCEISGLDLSLTEPAAKSSAQLQLTSQRRSVSPPGRTITEVLLSKRIGGGRGREGRVKEGSRRGIGRGEGGKTQNAVQMCSGGKRGMWPVCAAKNTITVKQLRNKQESCAIAKMTARCALYNWIEWAVAEIWPFEIIQDGGLPPTWIWCNRK